MYKIVKKCQICNSSLINFLDLGKQPLCDDLKVKPNSNKFYKLQIKFCKKCLTAFQKFNINKKILFPKSYHYRSANTQDVLSGMKDLVNQTLKLKKNLKGKNVLDIGCNDGSLLDFFKKKGSNTYGIEPTGAFAEAKKKKHIILNNYINMKTSIFLKKKVKKFDVITFTNVFAHIENFKELINSLKNLISKDTLVVIENHYLVEVIKKIQFDTFYHEHPRTYSLNSFFMISKLLGLNIVKYNFVKRYNGNIRVFLQKKRNFKINKKFQNDLKREKKIIKNVKNFQKKINLWKYKKRKFFSLVSKKNGAIPAKAFPGRASILINLLKLNNNNISKIYEKDISLKINKYAPGTNIKIVKETLFNKKDRDKKMIINLAWHISNEIKLYLKQKMKYSGKVINIITKEDFK